MLIVDDDADAVTRVLFVAPSLGTPVRKWDAPADGDEAMVVMHSWRPDIVLSDLAMPTADGYALVREGCA